MLWLFFRISKHFTKPVVLCRPTPNLCAGLFWERASIVCTPDLLSRARMPRKQKPSKEKQTAFTAVSSSTDSPVEVNAQNSITVRVLAKPGAKHNSITDISSEGVGVQIAAPPVDGEANTELVRYLAGILGLRKSDVSLEKGSRSRHKAVVVSGGLSKDEVISQLQSEIGK